MDKLKLTNTVVEVIEDEEDLTPQRLAAMDIIHQPGACCDRVQRNVACK